ncbi:ornithine cyclodeaminase family protein [Nocardia sp. CA-107356]|uniref:ornithine cyclodeaminase family protein n=1 Tax=Nocardia sp. CA-107356 TaxID=3239972 RepID=UPI003D8EDEB9
MLVLDGAQVRQVFSPAAAYQVVAEVMRRFSKGDVVQPVRTVLGYQGDGSLFAAMPCHVSGEKETGYGVKAVLHMPGNTVRGLPTHVGILVVFDPENGQPLGIIEGAAVTALRTAAASAVASDALALPEAGDLALLGAGRQARGHLVALSEIRRLRRVRLWNRGAERAEDFRTWAGSDLGIDVELVAMPAEALRGADLVCGTVGATAPLIHAVDLAEGCHINAVGASVPAQRELDVAAVAACSVFVDSRESALRESSDIALAIEEKRISPDLCEIGEVLLGVRPGRAAPTERTLYKSLGIAAQDVASGFAVVRAARHLGVGSVTEFSC